MQTRLPWGTRLAVAYTRATALTGRVAVYAAPLGGVSALQEAKLILMQDSRVCAIENMVAYLYRNKVILFQLQQGDEECSYHVRPFTIYLSCNRYISTFPIGV